MAPGDIVPALPWLAPFAALARLADTRPNLCDVPPVSGELVSVVIPARNEASTIETVVRSVLGSTYQPLELLVVDDRSTDATATILRQLATKDRRIRLVDGEPLPDGWYGKPWACQQGYRKARGDLLLFTDADTTHHPELLGRAVAALRSEGAGLLTVAPHQRCVTFWERLVMPQIWLLLGLRYHPRRVNRARRERDVIANGQFVLVPREAYESAGTHAAVRHEVAEDLALAQCFLRTGRRIHFAFADGFMETRMYRSRAAHGRGGAAVLADSPGDARHWRRESFRGGSGRRTLGAVLGPDIDRNADSILLRPGVSARRPHGAVHRGSLDLAG
ncbi:MAG: glycosyltransferase [Gemmatimonadales bacterium]